MCVCRERGRESGLRVARQCEQVGGMSEEDTLGEGNTLVQVRRGGCEGVRVMKSEQKVW